VVRWRGRGGTAPARLLLITADFGVRPAHVDGLAAAHLSPLPLSTVIASAAGTPGAAIGTSGTTSWGTSEAASC
jgi:hypothetical protein